MICYQKKRICGILVLVVLILFCSCHKEEFSEHLISMPVVISIPAGNMIMRVPGDPGHGENFKLPKEARFFIVKGSNDISQFQRTLQINKWKLSGDTYNYTENIVMKLQPDLNSGRVFVILSQEDIVLENENPQTEEEVKNLCFLFSKNHMLSLQNLYTNPVNDIDEQKNGTLIKDGPIIKASICCYHVAAKVDIMWNVNPDKQQQYDLQEITLVNLPQKGYLFYPSTMNDNFTGTQQVLSSVNMTPANKWMGRSVTYVLQSPDGSLNWEVQYSRTDGLETKSIKRSLVSRPEQTDQAFTGWYRIDARFGYTVDP